MAPEVSVVIVNFNSGPYLAACLESLGNGAPAGLEVVVVDNASPLDQSEHLAAAEARGARVLRLATNTGYAGGCNRGVEATSGPFVFLLNADVIAGPGALKALVRHLSDHPEVGCAEPCSYLDLDWVWRLPEFDLLTPREVLASSVARLSGRFAHRRGLRMLRRQVRGWQARDARECAALSGAFLATRREVLRRVGGMDEGYPLAFEDTDLCRRVRDHGWTLAHVPEARVIHLAHRSRLTVPTDSIAKDQLGRQRYLNRHHGMAAVWLDRSLSGVEAVARRLHTPRPRDPLLDLGTLREPPELRLTGAPGPFVMQLGLEPFFTLAVGQIGDGASYRFSRATWDSLLPTTLFVRAFSLDGRTPRGAWTFRRA